MQIMKTLIIAILLVCSACVMDSNNDEMDTVKIAMAQIFCVNSDTSGNFKRIEYAIEDALKSGAELICFPETSLFGWVNPEAHKMASPIPGESTDRLAGLARKHEVYICIGLCEKEGEKLYDSVILLDPQGTILLKHRKINILTELMDPPYTKGSGVQVVETEFGRIGLLVCADSFVPELLDEMKKHKPDIMLIPYGWANSIDKWPQHGESLRKTIQNVAQKLDCPVIGTDALGKISHGPWSGLVFGGQSYAIDYDGTVLARGRDRDRDIISLELKIRK
jgi:predicted amidohydrolase